MARTDLTGSATPSATGSQTRQGLIARLPTGSKSRSGMTVSPLDLRNSAGRSRRNNDSPTPRSPSIPPGNVYKPDRALATQFTISKSNDQPARRALVLGPLDSRSPLEGVHSGVPLFTHPRLGRIRKFILDLSVFFFFFSSACRLTFEAAVSRSCTAPRHERRRKTQLPARGPRR